jgi:acetyl-CoA acetyltransferase
VVSGRTAIVGLGITDMTRRRYDVTALDLAAEAVKLALEDCKLPKSKIDGLLVNGNMMSSEVRNNLQDALGLADLTFLNTMSAGGATAGSMVQYASFAIEAGLASVVALVFADAPLRRETSACRWGPHRGWRDLVVPMVTEGRRRSATPWPPVATCICSARRANSWELLRWLSGSGLRSVPWLRRGSQSRSRTISHRG